MAEVSPGIGNQSNDQFTELGMSGRTAHSSRLWIDNSGKRLPILYTFDSMFNEYDMFEEVINFWAENTCLTFKKGQQSRCSKKQSSPAIMLYSNGYSTEHFGIDKSKSCTKMSLGAGDRDIVHKLVMNVLGMLSYTYRKDSAKYISMNEENLRALLKVNVRELRAVLKTYHRCHGKTQVLPTPFDFLSKQMPFSTELGNKLETRPVYVTRDPRHQYLLDYHSAASVEPTFYDVLVINTLYKCPAEWAAACGSSAPSCKNHGYLLKTCRCRCPPGFSGDTCQTKSGPMFPLQPAAYEITVSTDHTYDFSSLNLKTANIADADSYFQFYIFIIIHIKPKKATHLPSVSLVLPFNEVGKKLGPITTKLMRYLGTADCLAGLRLLWGSGDRLACDCLSSLVNNEPAAEARVFRGRQPKMGMTLINNLDRTFKRQKLGLTKLTSQFRLLAEFRPPADLKVAKKPGSNPVPAGPGSGGGIGGGGGSGGGGAGGGAGGGSGGDEAGGGGGVGGVFGSGANGSDSDTLTAVTGAAMTDAFGGRSGLGLLAVLGPLGVILLALCLFLLLCRRKRRKKRRLDEETDDETEKQDDTGEEDDSEDGSEDSED